MKIINIISSLAFGGAETQIIKLSKQLVKMGHQVKIITLSDDNPRAEELANSGVELQIVPKKSKLDLTVVYNLYRAIKRWKPDIVHGYLYDAEFYARLAAWPTGIPVINSERNDSYKSNKTQYLGDLLTSGLTTSVIANSYAGKNFAMTRFPRLCANAFHVVWNGIDMKDVNQRIAHCNKDYKADFFGQKNIKLACMVASIKPQKDYEYALDIADNLIAEDEQWRVIFLGEKVATNTDTYQNKIFDKHQKLTNKDKIIFLGNRTDVLEILSQTDVSFLTSKHEGFPNAVLESMAVGTPVITTNFSDIIRISPFDWTIINDRNPAEFTTQLIKAGQLKSDLKSDYLRWTSANFSIETATNNLVDIYSIYCENHHDKTDH